MQMGSQYLLDDPRIHINNHDSFSFYHQKMGQPMRKENLYQRRTVKAQASLRSRTRAFAVSPEPLLFAHTV